MRRWRGSTTVVSETLGAETGGHDFEPAEDVVKRVMPFDEWLRRSSELLEQNGLVFGQEGETPFGMTRIT